MAKENYEVIAESKVINLDNETLKTLKVGDEVSGEFVLIDENPFLELPDGSYVSTDGLAKKIADEDVAPEMAKAEASVKSSNKKLIFVLIGGAVGYGIAHYMGRNMKQKILFTVGGIALGFTAEYINARRK
jgi:hypothetical protein